MKQPEALPVGWTQAAIAEMLSPSDVISDGDWIESKDQDPFGAIRLIQLADIGVGHFRDKSSRFMNDEQARRLNCTKLQAGDVLVARMPDPLGRACLFPVLKQECVTVVDVCLIRTGQKSAITNKLLAYWINSPSVRAEIEGMASGTTRKRITRKKLEQIVLPLPPLAEQKIIAAKLDELLAQVDTLKTRLDSIPKILKRFRQSVLAAAVSGRLTEGWGGRTNWRKVPLGQVISDGPQNGLYKPSIFYGEGTQIIRIDSFYDGELRDWSSIKRVRISDQELEKWKLKRLDILINRVNSIEYLGKCGLVRALPEDAVFESNIMRIATDQKLAQPEYVCLFLTSVIGVERLRKNAKLAINQASINQDDVKSCLIDLPGIKEQSEVVRRVGQLFAYSDQLEQQVKNALAKVNQLHQSILAKAFRGELAAGWCEQNSDLISGENSAQALLKRIEAVRKLVEVGKKVTQSRK